MPPKACDSPTATFRFPPRRLAATAVRPSFAVAERDASGGQPQIEIDAAEAVERDRPPVPVVAGEQADRGNIGRQIERLDRERALQGLAPVACESQRAFPDIAVELDIDGRERNVSADHVGLCLECESAEAAAGSGCRGRPA